MASWCAIALIVVESIGDDGSGDDEKGKTDEKADKKATTPATTEADKKATTSAKAEAATKSQKLQALAKVMKKERDIVAGMALGNGWIRTGTLP